MAVTKTKTQSFPEFIEPDVADCLYQYFRDNTEWVESIKSKGRHTRMGAIALMRAHQGDPTTGGGHRLD